MESISRIPEITPVLGCLPGLVAGWRGYSFRADSSENVSYGPLGVFRLSLRNWRPRHIGRYAGETILPRLKRQGYTGGTRRNDPEQAPLFQSVRLVGAVGIEPTTFGLKGRCSTTELRP